MILRISDAIDISIKIKDNCSKYWNIECIPSVKKRKVIMAATGNAV